MLCSIKSAAGEGGGQAPSFTDTCALSTERPQRVNCPTQDPQMHVLRTPLMARGLNFLMCMTEVMIVS